MQKDFTEEELDAIASLLSRPRFARYLRASGHDRERALCLYVWNAELCAACVLPLQFLEVAIRNSIAEGIEGVHGPNWPWMQGFQNTLPEKEPRKVLQSAAERYRSTGDVVANLRFSFWVSMLTKRHQKSLWGTQLNHSFPHHGQTNAIGARKALHSDLEAVRRFRNRVMHHEPIFDRDLQVDYERIERVLSWRCPATAHWLQRTQTVTDLLKQRP